MEKYRKAIVALVGAVALFVPEVAGLEGNVGAIYDGVVGILLAFGVFKVPNAPASPPPPPVSPEF